jgi:small-conductance mechanosensitive channel
MSFYGIRCLSAVIRHALEKYLTRSNDPEDTGRTIKGLFPVINIIVWSVGTIFLLDNLGFNISAVVAGLGIGGIAIALAAQALLGDMFSYFVILIDKPFELGDSITLGEFSGTVEHVGIKTTRIKSVNGEQVIFGNSDLTRSRVQNFKRLKERRAMVTISVSHKTPRKKLAAIPEAAIKILSKTKDVRYDRANLAKITDWGFTFEIVYFVNSNEFNVHMDIQQSIYLSLLEYLEKQKIALASPLYNPGTGKKG